MFCKKMVEMWLLFSGLTRIFANPSIWTLLVLLRVNRDFASTEGYFYTTGVQVTLFEHFNVFLMSSNGLYRWISLYHQPRSPFLYSISIFHIYWVIILFEMYSVQICAAMLFCRFAFTYNVFIFMKYFWN